MGVNETKKRKWYSLFNKIWAMPNLEVAFKEVKANRGASGVDKVTIKAFEANLEDNLRALQTALTSKIMNELELDSVMLITQYYHVSRTKLAFRKMNIKEVYSAHAKIFEYRDVYSIMREFPAYYKYLFN